jgi:hypothetical protein
MNDHFYVLQGLRPIRMTIYITDRYRLVIVNLCTGTAHNGTHSFPLLK